MAPTEDKKDRSTPPGKSPMEENLQLLREVGGKLSSYKEDINTFEIKKAADTLTDIYNKHHNSLDDKTNKLLNKLRGAAMFLSGQSAKTYKKFYIEALELGRKIKLLAEKLSVLAIPVIMNGDPLSFFG